MNLYEWEVVQAFRNGDREPLLNLLKDRGHTQPLPKEVYQIFIQLVEGKTGRPRGRPRNNAEDGIRTAYKVGVHIRHGLRVKEALDKVSRQSGRPFSYVKRAHQRYATHTDLLLGPKSEAKKSPRIF